MKSIEFRRERERSWLELEALVLRIEREGMAALSAREIARLPVLYRATVSSLSVARSISLDRNLLEYLEGLSVRAYFCVYGRKTPLRQTLRRFFTEQLPAQVRSIRWQILLATVALVAGGVAGYMLTSQDMERFYSFVGAMAGGRTPTTSTADLRAALYSEMDWGASLGNFASFLFSNNARIGLMCFALGFVAGVPVLLLLFINGLSLGAFVALYDSRGLGFELWAWLLPHGVPELLAVILCGAAGLVLSSSLLFPGRGARLDNLARRGREAGIVVLGGVLLFAVAAVIEGFFRQIVHSVEVRCALAAVNFLLCALYFGVVGRRGS